MFGAQCYFDATVRKSQGLVRVSLETLGAWSCNVEKPVSTDMGPPAAGLAATIATDTTSVGQPQAAEGARIFSNQHSSLIVVWEGGGHPLVSWQNPHARQDSREFSESGIKAVYSSVCGSKNKSR